MKRFGYLYEKVFETDNLRIAIMNASKGKRNRKEVKAVFDNLDETIKAIQESRCITGEYKEKVVVDRASQKVRHVLEPKFNSDQIIHHAIIQVIEPIFMKGMYKFCSGSVKSRGTLYASKYVRKVLSKDKRGTKYFAKLDVRKYYDNVDHDILKALLSRRFKDQKLLKLLFSIIDSVPSGIPIGNYTSQWFANFYLEAFDHYVKEILKVPYYVRYMDDMVIIGPNKRKLRKAIESIKEYLITNLKLKTHDHEQVMKVKESNSNDDDHNDKGSMFIDFAGFKHYRNVTTIRKRTWKKIRHMFFSIKKKLSLCKARRFMSYYGAIKNSDSFYIKNNFFKMINFNAIRKCIGGAKNGKLQTA